MYEGVIWSKSTTSETPVKLDFILDQHRTKLFWAKLRDKTDISYLRQKRANFNGCHNNLGFFKVCSLKFNFV